MSPATWPRGHVEDERLLFIDPHAAAWSDGRIRELPARLRAGDLLVVNDAATLPASLAARTSRGATLELRLTTGAPDGEGCFGAVLFGAGDWRTPTEHRAAPERVAMGEVLDLEGLAATVSGVSSASPRLVELRFAAEDAALWAALYRRGRPVQYAYLAGPLDLWHVQTLRYAARPWAAELPSAGRPLAWSVLLGLARAGVRMATLTHAAGLSSTGDPTLDAMLPFPERYHLPGETVEAVARTRDAGGRVVAIGTSVVRALEGSMTTHGRLFAGEGVTDLRIGPGFRPRVVDGLFTGLHEPTASHFQLLQAFAPGPLIEDAYAHASRAGYLCHEFGDSNLILAA